MNKYQIPHRAERCVRSTSSIAHGYVFGYVFRLLCSQLTTSANYNSCVFNWF